MRSNTILALGAHVVTFVVIANCASGVPTSQGGASGLGTGGASGSASGGGSGSGGTGSSGNRSGGSGSSGTAASGSGTGSGGSSGSSGSGSSPGSIMSTGGCAGNGCANPMCKAAPGWTPPSLASEPYPSVGLAVDGSPDLMPKYIPNNYVIPTLDDVPDGASGTPNDGYLGGNWTTQDLAFLDSKNLHWDLFINTDNWAGPLVGDPAVDDMDAYSALADILKLHNPANHTVHHIWMSAQDQPADPANPTIPQCCDCTAFPVDSCDSELQGVESVASKISGGGIPHLTRFRPPYGYPYISPQGPYLANLQKVVSKYAVVVGWNLLPTQDADYAPACAACGPNNTPVIAHVPDYDTKQSVEDHVTSQLGNAPGAGTAWGIVLMHGVLPWTHDAIVELFDPDAAKSTPANPNVAWIAKHGFKTATVEDVICWKYGMHSWDVINTINNYKGTPQERKPN